MLPLGVLTKKAYRDKFPRKPAMANHERVHGTYSLVLAPIAGCTILASLLLRNPSLLPFVTGVGFATLGWRISCVGLTGGIGSGKSTACKHLTEKGCTVVDADIIARAVVARNTPGFEAIVKTFGSDVVNPVTGELNRAALGDIVFSDRAAKARLERITHPRIMLEMVKQVFFNRLMGRCVVMDVPLLFESHNKLGLSLLCNETILIDLPEDDQMRRLRERNPELSVEDAQNRIRSQLDRTEKRKLADYIIRNDTSVEALRARLDELFGY